MSIEIAIENIVQCSFKSLERCIIEGFHGSTTLVAEIEVATKMSGHGIIYRPTIGCAKIKNTTNFGVKRGCRHVYDRWSIRLKMMKRMGMSNMR